MLENGFGEHNIQGIGDKHIPLIHNVMNTDVVSRDQRHGHRRARRAVQHRRRAAPSSPTARASPPTSIAALAHFGFSSIVQRARRDQDRQAARPRSRRRGRSPSPPTAAAMYPSERAKTIGSRFGGAFTPADAAEVFGEHLGHVTTEHMIELHRGRPPADLQPRLLHVGRAAGHAVRAVRGSAATRSFWRGLRRYLGVWDEMITDFNARVAG